MRMIPIALFMLSATAQAAVLHVPRQFAALQTAIDAAAPGDTIIVHRGRYCGATVTKPVTLIGRGHPTIIGCASNPTLAGALRIGLFLDGTNGTSPASGTTIVGFDFDGAGISNSNLTPLAFGVFSRFADDVVVADNEFHGTIQAITDTAGDHWMVSGNRIHGLTLLDCGPGGFCGGGDAVVFELSRDEHAAPGGAANDANRPQHNQVLLNEISGTIPDHFDAFSMTGVLLLAADDSFVFGNELAIPKNPTGAAKGEGIVVTNSCCGQQQHFTPATRDAVVIGNDGERSQFVLVVEGNLGENTAGFVAFANEGKVLREDLGQTAAQRLSATRTLLTPIHAPF